VLTLDWKSWDSNGSFKYNFRFSNFEFSYSVYYLSLVLYGYWLYRRLNFKRHGIVMSCAVFVQLAAFFVIMAPSFVFAILPSFIVPQPFELVSIVSLLHELAGGLAFVFGIWLLLPGVSAQASLLVLAKEDPYALR
jgi:hypothetical protein